uniref:Uncharacterized protein n=1 Tax=Arundo donax TaxID=35708 RepID=A0A0A9GK43_ARUDO
MDSMQTFPFPAAVVLTGVAFPDATAAPSCGDPPAEKSLGSS